jgi:hypothetical protein
MASTLQLLTVLYVNSGESNGGILWYHQMAQMITEKSVGGKQNIHLISSKLCWQPSYAETKGGHSKVDLIPAQC